MDRPRAARALVLVFLLLAATYGYFLQGGGWNQAVRMDLCWSLVERGTPAIGAYAANSGDIAIFGDRVFSTKAPGASFLAVPVHATLKLGLEAAGHPVDTPAARALSGHLATWLLAGCATAGMAALMGSLARRWYGAGTGQAVWIALAFGLGTMAFPFATVLLGHNLAALFGLLALALALPGGAHPPRPAWAGLAAGMALLTDYPAAVFGVVVFAVLAWRRRSPAVLSRYALGALPPVLLLAAYHQACFGSPLATGYAYQTEMFQHHDEAVLLGLFSLPHLDRLWAVTFGLERGLFSLYPLTLLGLVAPALVWRRPEARTPLLASSSVFLYFLLLNASYPVWDGGYASGPRHLMAGLPFLVLPAATLLAGRARAPVLALTILSVAMATAVTLVNPLGPYQVGSLFGDYILPALAAGRVSENFFRWWPGWQPATPAEAALVARNLGELIGLRGVSSILPLLGFWALGGGGLWWALRSGTDAADDASAKETR
ncbi:MAG: hypothetical protein ABIO70_31310 [Pseudomonadota bacterium]